MMWQVRALLEDRPGAMAAITAGCGEHAVNILALQIFPAPDGRVLDELVLHTPGGWTAEDVTHLFARAGVDAPSVRPCSPHALEDQPVRYLRAARTVAEAPDLLQDQLCRLLDADPVEEPAAPGASEVLVLDDEDGPAVRLSRPSPFTDTEVARVAELRRIAAAALVEGAARSAPVTTRTPPPAVPPGIPAAPAEGASVEVRGGVALDVDALVAMHARCSAETLRRRYHVPMSTLSPSRARALLEPAEGVSLVATSGGAVVGTGLVVQGAEGAEIAVMVEDGWQRQGIGAKLVRALAERAALDGADVVCLAVQPDNSAAPRTLRSAGLRARVSIVDGVAEYRVPVGKLAESARRRRNRPAMGEVTTPLVALLHGRRELREVYPAADFLDQAVRGGA